jgi:F-type H+-transporting ATPase subunit a
MPEHTSILTYILALFPALRANAKNLGVSFPPPGHEVEYRGIEPVFASVLVMLFIVGLAVRSRRSLRDLDASVVPDEALTVRTFLDAFVGYFYDMAKDVMGPKNAKRYFGLIGASALYVFFSNCLALVPGMTPPTANFNVTFACATYVFIAFNFWGVKENGWGYLAHFAGPKWYLAPLVFPIEMISTCVRPFTLAIRLMVNMAVDHLVGSIFLGLIGLLVPLPAMFLGVIVILVQTLVFCLLTSIYIGLATERSEGH